MGLYGNIRTIRTDLGMSGAVVARKLDISPAAFFRYERGEVIPSADIIIKLSQVFNCTTDDLLGPKKSHQTKSKLQTIELDLKEGDTLTLQVVAKVLRANQESDDEDESYDEGYTPVRHQSIQEKAHKKKRKAS